MRLKEGTWFVVPDGPGFVLGLLARATELVGFGYFFGPRLAAPPELAELPEVDPPSAILACRFTLGGLRCGDWPCIGISPGWQRDDWRVPPLGRFDWLDNEYRLVLYEKDLTEPEAELPLPTDENPRSYPSDDVFGEGLLPDKLSRLLG